MEVERNTALNFAGARCAAAPAGSVGPGLCTGWFLVTDRVKLFAHRVFDAQV